MLFRNCHHTSQFHHLLLLASTLPFCYRRRRLSATAHTTLLASSTSPHSEIVQNLKKMLLAHSHGSWMSPLEGFTYPCTHLPPVYKHSCCTLLSACTHMSKQGWSARVSGGSGCRECAGELRVELADDGWGSVGSPSYGQRTWIDPSSRVCCRWYPGQNLYKQSFFLMYHLWCSNGAPKNLPEIW